METDRDIIPCPSWGIYTISGVPYLHQEADGLGRDFLDKVNSPYKVTTNPSMLRLKCPHRINFYNMCKPKWVPDKLNIIFWSYVPNWLRDSPQHILIESLNPINLHTTLCKLQLLGSVVRPESTIIVNEKRILTQLKAELNLSNTTPFTTLDHKVTNPHLWQEISNLVKNCQRPMVFVGSRKLIDYPHILRVPYKEGEAMIEEAQQWMKDHMTNMLDIKSLPSIGSYLIFNLKK